MTEKHHENLLLIAVRSPVPGLTKTRLGAAIGMERASELYRAFLDDLSGRFMGGERNYDLGWAYTPESEPFDAVIRELRPELDPCSVRYVRQVGANWGDRQTNLLHWGAQQGYARTVLTASDSPQMSRAMIDQAFAALEISDVVVGRVHDGGYYLIGVRGFHDVLSGVPMSTTNAAEALVARALSMGLRIARVEPTFDVDVEEDLPLLTELLQHEPEAAPATLRALCALGLVPDRALAGHNDG
ncbi:MAG: TIGR04282 family arsenosugar biosynthesis glycosyltransferase [Thermomicrobiales bacterium]